MPRYDASKDEDLKKAVKHIREKQFFLGQYRKRKFVTDKSSLFDETVSDEEKRRCNCSDMTYADVKNIYTSLISEIDQFLFLRDFIDLDAATTPLAPNNRTNEILQIINGLQWHLAVYENKLAQSGISPPCQYNIEHCKFLLSFKEIHDIVEKLTRVSLRYGLLITDLCSDFFAMDIKDCVDADEQCLFTSFFHYLDFDHVRNTHVLQEGDYLQRNRLKKYYNNTICNEKIGRLEASSAKKALAGLLPGSFYSNSTLRRRAGLWLWDNYENPLIKQEIKKADAFHEAIQKMRSINSNLEDIDEFSLTRELNRVYAVTKRSIIAGEILPMECKIKK